MLLLMEETLGRRIKQLRDAKGLGQKELGRIVGRSESWVSNVESGKIAELKAPQARLMASALGVSLDELLGQDQVVEAPAAFDADAARLAEIGRQVVDLVKREASSFVIPTERIEIVPDRPAEPMIEVPVYDRFAASYLGSSGGQAGDRMSVPQRLWKRAQEPRLIYVSGPCLALRGILSGDYLVVDAANRDPRDGDVVAFRFRGEEAVKVCFRFEDRIEFRPTIETFPTITVRLGDEEDLEIVGISVGLVMCAERG